MVSESVKQAILDGAYAISRDGKKCKFVGRVSEDHLYSHLNMFIYLDNEGFVKTIHYLNDDLLSGSHGDFDNDVVGLWEDRIEEFDLKRALNGEPVMLRNGLKAFVKFVMPEGYTGKYPVNGYMPDPDEMWGFDTESWTLDGKAVFDEIENGHDIIGMWKEPKTQKETITPTLPCPLKEPKDDMWLIFLCNSVRKSNYGKDIPLNEFENGVYFNSEADAQAWVDAMKNNRR